MSLRSLLAHPHRQLRRSASPARFRECLSADGDEKGVARFRSEAEEALDCCFCRTAPPFAPAAGEAAGRWLVDWGRIVGLIGWDELFSDHDGPGHSKEGGTTALREVCLAVRKVAWTEHRHRTDEVDKLGRRRRSNEEECCSESVATFHDAQLRVLQKVFLDLWTDRALGRDSAAGSNNLRKDRPPFLAPSDRFMYEFVSEQLARPFLESASPLVDASCAHSMEGTTSIWDNLMRQYTESLGIELRSLTRPPKLNPIPAIISGAKFVKGHDVHTRMAMFRRLVSRMRRWVDLLTGLERERIGDETLPSKAGESVASEALSRLSDMLKSEGAMGLLSSEEGSGISQDSPPLDIVRCIHESLQEGGWTQEKLSQTNDHPPKKQPTLAASECATPFHSKAPLSPKLTSISFRCIIRDCRNSGTLSNSGMCPHHCQRLGAPHPFNWEDVIPHAASVQIMKRLKQRGMGPNDNVHDAIIREVKRLQFPKGASSGGRSAVRGRRRRRSTLIKVPKR